MWRLPFVKGAFLKVAAAQTLGLGPQSKPPGGGCMWSDYLYFGCCSCFPTLSTLVGCPKGLMLAGPRLCI
jgi:hypothetical protein